MEITNELIIAIKKMPGIGDVQANLILDYVREHDEVTLEEIHECIREYNAKHSRVRVPNFASFLKYIEDAKEMLAKKEEHKESANKLRLRPFRTPDASTIITWTNEPEGFYKWTAGIMGSYPVSEERFLEAVSAREYNPRYLALTAFDEEGPVGFFTVRTPGEDDKKVRFGYVIIDPSKRGRGYGKRMLELGLKYVFEIYGAEEVSLGVFENNEPAYYCYRSAGFADTGMREEYSICGETWVDIEMVVRREDQQ